MLCWCFLSEKRYSMLVGIPWILVSRYLENIMILSVKNESNKTKITISNNTYYILIPFTPSVVRFGVSSISYLIGWMKEGSLTSFHGNSSSNSHGLSLHEVARGIPSLKYLDSSCSPIVLWAPIVSESVNGNERLIGCTFSNSYRKGRFRLPISKSVIFLTCMYFRVTMI